nr:hypothetical protein [Endozoicomonas sp.]
MHRRTFIKSSLALAGVSLIGTGCSSTANQVLISAARDSSGNDSIRLTDPYKGQCTVIPVSQRLHDVSLRPGSNEVVVFERRPGYQLYVINFQSAQITRA